MNGYQTASQNYQPAVVPPVGTVKHSSKKLAVATVELPHHVCGQALRVGYTGTAETDLAIYRIKIKSGPNRLTITLSGFFVLEQGIFHAYER